MNMTENFPLEGLKNVLVFPCGSEIGLEINRSLANSIHFKVFGVSSVDDHGRFVYKNYIPDFPFVDSDDFIDKLNQVIERYKIDFIFPAHDSVVLKLAQNIDKIAANVITSSLGTCEICRSKTKTYKVLEGVIKTPKVYSVNDKNIDYPIFIKPDVGQGSKGAKRINTAGELEAAYLENSQIVISEYLPGKEYTVDCFTNRQGELLFAQGRERARISNGISVNSMPVQDSRFQEIALKINSVLKFQGVWFFQLKQRSDNELVLMEVAPRIAGTMGLYRGLGINFAQLSLFDAMGVEVSIQPNNFSIEIDRALFSRYKTNLKYNTVYVDLDDTLIVNENVNAELMKLLYQEKNHKKKIILISKHSGNIESTLKKFNISFGLFDEIIHLERNQNKCDFVKYKNAIFIDDSFNERLSVLVEHNIPVFSVDAIDVLLDWKN